jgi:hypothetical protein
LADQGGVEVIHRLKNHIAIIVGFCELLIAETPASDPRRADLLEVQKAATDAMGILPEVARCAQGGISHHV